MFTSEFRRTRGASGELPATKSALFTSVKKGIGKEMDNSVSVFFLILPPSLSMYISTQQKLEGKEDTIKVSYISNKLFCTLFPDIGYPLKVMR